MSEASGPPSIQANTRGYTKYKSFASRIHDALDTPGHAPGDSNAGQMELKGFFCLAVSTLEIYFTFAGSEVAMERFRSHGNSASPGGGFSSDYQACFKTDLRIKPRAVKFGAFTGRREDVFSDFGAVTLNKPHQIQPIIGLLQHLPYDADTLWENIASRVGDTGSQAIRERLELLVERRNLIMHYGDFTETGVAGLIQKAHVRSALEVTSGVVEEAEARFTGMDSSILPE